MKILLLALFISGCGTTTAINHHVIAQPNPDIHPACHWVRSCSNGQFSGSEMGVYCLCE